MKFPQTALSKETRPASHPEPIRETTIGHVKQFTPKASPELYAQAIDYVQDLFLSKGVTAHRTAEGDENDLIALKAKADAGEIKLHWAVGMNVNFAQSTYDHRRAYAANCKPKPICIGVCESKLCENLSGR